MQLLFNLGTVMALCMLCWAIGLFQGYQRGWRNQKIAGQAELERKMRIHELTVRMERGENYEP